MADLVDLISTAAAFYRQELSPFQLKIYARALDDLNPSAVERALDIYFRTGKWFPAPSELRELVEEMNDDGTPVDRAWFLVKEQIARTGSYGQPYFDDPAVADAVKAIGWKYLCMSEDEMADRAHFLKIYDVTQRRHQRQRAAPDWGYASIEPRAGFHEIEPGDDR